MSHFSYYEEPRDKTQVSRLGSELIRPIHLSHSSSHFWSNGLSLNPELTNLYEQADEKAGVPTPLSYHGWNPPSNYQSMEQRSQRCTGWSWGAGLVTLTQAEPLASDRSAVGSVAADGGGA